jgi:hypothetical protein
MIKIFTRFPPFIMVQKNVEVQNVMYVIHFMHIVKKFINLAHKYKQSFILVKKLITTNNHTHIQIN